MRFLGCPKQLINFSFRTCSPTARVHKRIHRLYSSIYPTQLFSFVKELSICYIFFKKCSDKCVKSGWIKFTITFFSFLLQKFNKKSERRWHHSLACFLIKSNALCMMPFWLWHDIASCGSLPTLLMWKHKIQ